MTTTNNKLYQSGFIHNIKSIGSDKAECLVIGGSDREELPVMQKKR